MDIYKWADNTINAAPRYETGFTQLLATKPYRIPDAVRRAYDSRLPVIRSFQQTAVDIFRAALKNELDPIILKWLINETPESMGVSFHRSLEDRHFTLPLFFRTDEARPGKIVEIQCPGSLWGELQLLFEYSARMEYCVGDVSPADQFTSQVTDYLGLEPVVQHFLDMASIPSGMRYFIEKTRPGMKYWAIDRGIKVDDCNLIRHHAFIELWADINLHSHLSRAGNGLVFDYPPYVLFDEKAPMALPFWSKTRDLFSDDVRDLFPYTTPLLPGGFELPDGVHVTVEEFCQFPKSQRSYYLKLAGFNIEMNWGSKAVYRLSNFSRGACLEFMQQCLSEYEDGRVWLLQKEDSQEDDIEYVARDGSIHNRRMRAKFSGFYGPGSCFGVVVMHRHHHKVHGQDETVLSYVISNLENPVKV